MDVAMEDDVFFADLSKQISLLIMDDEEEELINHSRASVSFEGFSQPIYQQDPRLPRVQEQQQVYRRECKGTGVFIPRSSHPRRKSKQERYNSSQNAKLNKHFDSSRGFPPQNSKAESCNRVFSA